MAMAGREIDIARLMELVERIQPDGAGTYTKVENVLGDASHIYCDTGVWYEFAKVPITFDPVDICEMCNIIRRLHSAPPTD